MVFYDFEVFKYDWLAVLKNPETRDNTVIINDPVKLAEYYEENKNDIWCGYNSRSYDQFILKAILLGFDPKKVNDWIIVSGKSGWQFSRLMNNYPVLNYDVMTSMHSLKQLEGFMGNSIKETSVSFDIDRKLTPQEISDTVKYCESDVDNLIEVFIERIEEFNSAMDLIKTFKLPLNCISKTKAQMSAIILDCTKQARDDEWDISIVDTLKLSKYDFVREWFLNNRGDYTKNLTATVAGVPHQFGWGGLHGAREKYQAEGLILHVDVNSYYPSLMIEYDLLTRNCREPQKFKEIYDKRLALKKAGKKKEQAPYKIVLNGTYGICKDKYNSAYDPRQANNVCINGQLLLLDLIEKLEAIEGFELIQSNTDGLIVKIPDTEAAFNQADDICYEWEQRTKMGLSFDYIKKIVQKDVNNYVFIDVDDKLECKGAYVKKTYKLDNDMPILNKALVDYIAYNIPIEVTINECNELIQFQKIVKVSSKYLAGVYNGVVQSDRTFRVFASTDENDGYIGKIKAVGATVEKFANTPDNCFILNGDVNGVTIPSRLNKQWYIDLAKKRLNDYGVMI